MIARPGDDGDVIKKLFTLVMMVIRKFMTLTMMVMVIRGGGDESKSVVNILAGT